MTETTRQPALNASGAEKALCARCQQPFPRRTKWARFCSAVCRSAKHIADRSRLELTDQERDAVIAGARALEEKIQRDRLLTLEGARERADLNEARGKILLQMVHRGIPE